jgi:hypothetical protein
MANENEGAMRSRTWTTSDRQTLIEHIDESLMFTPQDYTVTVSSLGSEGGFTVTETWRDVCPADRQRFAALCNRGGNDN